MKHDMVSVVPFAFVLGRLIVSPAAVRRISGQTVANYALTEKAIQTIQQYL
ncbi:MAG: hypothetical protein ACJ788_06475 [Ktedonobacteraceae bacterium]